MLNQVVDVYLVPPYKYFENYSKTKEKKYGNRSFIDERHRHRYEVNPDMVPRLEEAGLSFSGKRETGRRMEIVELPTHPYLVGIQFHPEFKSGPGRPSALVLGTSRCYLKFL
ncbi:unnamed protein product [Fraxinus pennsylvanica]|uniref:CTP synthase (glutamine hydrolyzing) n=1 Tax=Fraxinus pennsylvanica TaxID=56036 RepID=A0AAD2EFV7_9LAMI|nr:unnamed protein product [Fraxinus pennsylvanica]